MRPVRRLAIVLVMFSLLFASPFTVHSVENGPGSFVNIQVSDGRDIEDLEAVKIMMDELVKRGIKATLWLSASRYPPEICAYIQELSQKGYEISAKANDDLSLLDHKEQLAITNSIVNAIKECTGEKVLGFRSTRFTWNEHTIKIVNELKFSYCMHDFDEDPRYGDEPYYPRGYSFLILGVTKSVYSDGMPGILCDAPACRRGLSPQEYEDLCFTEIDRRITSGKPIVFEWHPADITQPDESNPWWHVFKNILDYLESKGDRVWFETSAGIARYHHAALCLKTKSRN